MAQLSSKKSLVAKGFSVEKSIRNSLFPGRPLKLREGIYNQLKDREWLFNKFENDTVFLIHSTRAYGIAVRMMDIDWEATNLKPSRQ